MKNSNVIEEFVMDFEKSSTQRIYRNHINSFFDVIKVNPDAYFQDDRNYNKDLLTFWQSINNLAPITRAGRITCVKQFMEENDVQIIKKVWRKIKRAKKAIPRTVDHVPTPTELKQILQHGGIKDRALFLLMASSGLRINEALNITFNDIVYKDVNGNLISPAKIIIRQDESKNDVPRITYFSDEAKDALIEWLKVRNAYLKSAVERCIKRNLPKSLEDNRIFPFGWTTSWRMWHRLLRKSGYDKKDPSTNRFEIHIHCLRKYFINRLKGVIRADAVEQMAGHEGYLDRSYRKIPESELASLYNQGMHSLAVFEHPTDISDVHEQLKEVTHENKGYEHLIQQLKIQNERLESVSNHQFDRIRMLEYRMEDMSYQRALDQDQNTTEEMKEKEYLKKFPTAKERKRDWDRLYNSMKTDKNMTPEEKLRYWFLNDRIYRQLRNKEGTKKHWTDELITPKDM